MPSPAIVEYVWVSGADAHHDIRSKIKVIWQDTPKDITLADCSEWNFDGSSTGQAEAGKDTEILIRAVAIWPHPFIKESRAWVVLCECFLPNGKPTPDNHRFAARSVFEHPAAKDLDPWYGIEQECVLMRNGRPFGWPKHGFPAAQGPYYCANGPFAYGRGISNTHLTTCINMGLKLSGTNAEVMPGQWEYQVGPCQGIEAGDHMIMARWVMLRIVEELSTDADHLDVSFDVKPIKGDWNGSGMHTNFSTVAMRKDGGLAEIKKAMERMEKTVAKDIRFYSLFNNQRLTGHHETSRLDQFAYGVGTRHTSCRIPNQVAKDQKGYFEDRRPGSDADPYLVSATVFSSACGIPAPVLEEIAHEMKQEWMPPTPRGENGQKIF